MGRGRFLMLGFHHRWHPRVPPALSDRFYVRRCSFAFPIFSCLVSCHFYQCCVRSGNPVSRNRSISWQPIFEKLKNGSIRITTAYTVRLSCDNFRRPGDSFFRTFLIISLRYSSVSLITNNIKEI